MIDTMNTHELVITNTWFQKAKEQQVTYREIGTARDNKNFEPTQFAEFDHCVATNKWRNNIIDVFTDVNKYFPSQHYPQIIKYRRKLKMKEEKTRPIKWKGVQYDDKEQLEEYNTMFQLLFWENDLKENREEIVLWEADFVSHIALFMVALHFYKLILEAIFALHNYSGRKTSIRELAWEVFLYWGVLGIFVGYNIFHTQYYPPLIFLDMDNNSLTGYVFIFFFIATQGMNLMCHVHFKQ